MSASGFLAHLAYSVHSSESSDWVEWAGRIDQTWILEIMGGERLDIMNICYKKERESGGNNLSPGCFFLSVSWPPAASPLLLLQGSPGVVNGTLVQSTEVMSLSGQLFVARLKVRKRQARLPSIEWDLLVALLLCSSPEVPSQFTCLFPPFRVFLWCPLALFSGLIVVLFCRYELGERSLYHLAWSGSSYIFKNWWSSGRYILCF